MKRYLLLMPAYLMNSMFVFCQHKTVEIFFKEKQFLQMELANKNVNRPDYYFYKAAFANVSNKPALSNRYLDTLASKDIPPGLQLNFWKLRADNYVKCFDYKKAFETNHYINQHFKSQLSDEHFKGSLNTELIWKSLQQYAPQTIVQTGDVTVALKKDFGGLFNIPVHINNTDSLFVFDTGAGISVIAKSLAQKLGLNILDSDSIKVSGFTGIGNETRMAIADCLSIGNIKIYNAYFLIFNDEALTFADGQYKINGIIGFPILKEIGSISLGKDSVTFSSVFKSVPLKERNLFTEYLHPILFLRFNGELLPFCLDTGGNETLFSRSFFERYQSLLLKEPHKNSSEKVASVGGEVKYQSIIMDRLSLRLNQFGFSLSQLEINKDQYHRFGKEFYGNFGKDALVQFRKVVMSFKGNYLEFIR